jgi:hypothetical protein
LGTNALFGYRYNVSLIGGNTAYSSIHVNKEGQIVYATTDIYNTDDSKAFQPFDSQITSTLQNLRSDMSALSFYPEVGHIYLINIYDGQYGETYLTKVRILTAPFLIKISFFGFRVSNDKLTLIALLDGRPRCEC